MARGFVVFFLILVMVCISSKKVVTVQLDLNLEFQLMVREG